MDIFTLYVAQGALAVVRTETECIIVDAHMPDCETISRAQIERTLKEAVGRRRVRGLILTGLDQDHAHPAGVDSILQNQSPDWVMYPKYFKDTESSSAVFQSIERAERTRRDTGRPLLRCSVRLDKIADRVQTGLADSLGLELFSPHPEDMDSSNNCSIVARIWGTDHSALSYLVTGDTEVQRWQTINRIFGGNLRSDVMAAPHHGSISGTDAETLILVEPHTVIISAGVKNQYDHPDQRVVAAFRRACQMVFATNADDSGLCFLTRRRGEAIETHSVRHSG